MIYLRTRLLTVSEAAVKLAAKHITPKRLAFLCGFAYFSSLIPLLFIAQYNRLSSDDFTYGAAAYHTWRHEGSILAVLKAAVQVSVDTWHNFQGTYISLFLTALQPSIFGQQYYAITTWIALGILTFSVVYMFRTLLVKILSVDKHLCHIISFVTLFMIVHFMDYWPRIEMFFWHTTLWIYLFAHCIALVFLSKIAAVVAEGGNTGKRKYLSLLLASLLGIISGGGGYMAITFTLLVSVVIIWVAARRKKRQALIQVLIPIGFFVMSSMLNIFAPGNAARQLSEGEPLGLVEAVFSSFLFIINGTYVLRAMVFPMMILILFLVPAFYKAVSQTTFRFRYPLVVLLASICLLAATAAPPIYAGVTMLRARLLAILFIVFVLLVILNVFYLIGWISHRWSRPMDSPDKRHLFSPSSCSVILTSALVALLVMGMHFLDEYHSFTFSSAMRDIYSGKAKAYSEARHAWDVVLTEANSDEEAVIDDLPEIPTLFNKAPISPHGSSYYYPEIAAYYGLDSVWIVVSDD